MASKIDIEIVACVNAFEIHAIQDGKVIYRAWANDVLEAGEMCRNMYYFYKAYVGNKKIRCPKPAQTLEEE